MKLMMKIMFLMIAIALCCVCDAGPTVSYQAATNISRLTVMNMVAGWARTTNPAPVTVEMDPSVALTGRVLTVKGTQVEIPRQGVMSLTAATNYTDTTTTALSNATWAALHGKAGTSHAATHARGGSDSFAPWIAGVGAPANLIGQPVMEMGAAENQWFWYTSSGITYVAYTEEDSPSTLNFSVLYDWRIVFTATRDRIAWNSDITTTANGLYSAASGNALAAQVATIGAHLNAEDAQFIVTNYNSVTRMPEAYFKIKLPDQSWTVIWDEMTRFNWLTNSFLPTSYASKTELNEKADRAWGYYDSHSGLYAPDGYTWISSPKIAIAADLAYQRTITSAGNVWVLCSQGMVTETGGDTNGYFRIYDNKGHTAFEIIAGEERLIGAPVTNVTTAANTIIITYPVNVRPTIEVCDSLTNHLWKVETDSDCIATVTWSGQAGAWVATVAAKQTPQPQMFVQATYKTGGETIVRNTAPVSLTHVYIGGTKYAVGTATISGHTVMTLTPAN